mgnify:FL=1
MKFHDMSLIEKLQYQVDTHLHLPVIILAIICVILLALIYAIWDNQMSKRATFKFTKKNLIISLLTSITILFALFLVLLSIDLTQNYVKIEKGSVVKVEDADLINEDGKLALKVKDDKNKTYSFDTVSYTHLTLPTKA